MVGIIKPSSDASLLGSAILLFSGLSDLGIRVDLYFYDKYILEDDSILKNILDTIDFGVSNDRIWVIYRNILSFIYYLIIILFNSY